MVMIRRCHRFCYTEVLDGIRVGSQCEAYIKTEKTKSFYKKQSVCFHFT